MDSKILEMTFYGNIKRITGWRLLFGTFGLTGFCKAVGNPWPTLMYSCFTKMLLGDSARSPCNSDEAHFRVQVVFDHIKELCCFGVCECFWLLHLWLQVYQKVLDYRWMVAVLIPSRRWNVLLIGLLWWWSLSLLHPWLCKHKEVQMLCK